MRIIITFALTLLLTACESGGYSGSIDPNLAAAAALSGFAQGYSPHALNTLCSTGAGGSLSCITTP